MERGSKSTEIEKFFGWLRARDGESVQVCALYVKLGIFFILVGTKIKRLKLKQNLKFWFRFCFSF